MALETKFVGSARGVLPLAVWGGVATIATLGLYRCWIKARFRRWYWSAIQPGGHPLEYTGLGGEKFQGFLIAVVALALYITVVNSVLMYLGFAALNSEHGGPVMAVVAIAPMVIYARYRARAYLLGRTRWRGIRFGLAAGAGGYVLRMLAGILAVGLTLGAALPYVFWELDRYITERTWWGTAQMRMEGDWRELIPAARYLWIGLGALLLVAAAALFIDRAALFGLLIAGPLTLGGWAYFRAEGFRIMTNAKSVGDMRLRANPDTKAIVGTVFVGVTVVYGGLAAAVTLAQRGFDGQIAAISYNDMTELLVNAGAQWVILASFLAVMIAIYLLWSVLMHLVLVLPLLKLYATAVSVEGDGFGAVAQRDEARFATADGFGEALDLGAGL
ncbi:MAG: DUF898 family protein [Pseudomonadota bacterium]